MTNPTAATTTVLLLQRIHEAANLDADALARQLHEPPPLVLALPAPGNAATRENDPEAA